LLALLVTTALWLVSTGVSAAESEQAIPVTVSCADLVAPKNVEFSEESRWVNTEGLPRYCRVRGTIQARTQFEMRLPSQWNGRFLMAGCGGFCGSLIPDKPGHSNSINEALKRGYAAISHDGGHQADSWETRWASDRDALELWAHKVLPVVVDTGTELATALYGREPRYRYFSGCSNGGRLGLQAAQRYPELFDGIAAGGSIFELSGIAGLWGNWLIRNNQNGLDSRIPQSKVPLIRRVVMETCDSLDGQADGIITDPRACHVDFGKASCDATVPPAAENCLSGREAQILNTLYGGVKNGQGDVIYPAVAFGSEHYVDRWLFGADGNPAWGVLASQGYRQMLAMDLSEKDVPAGLPTDQMLDWLGRSSIPALTDAVDPDLSGLRQAGSKLLIYQGWSDPLIIPEPITDYYGQAAEVGGGMEKLQEIARLFMVPGWGHCWERPADAPDSFDPLLELEQWVEEGRAPQFIVARQFDDSGVERRARPVCSYPAVAKLLPGKDPNRHDSYQCLDGPITNM
jgi:feruloyl esterase